MKKNYTIQELFKLSWSELTTKEHATLLVYINSWNSAKEKELIQLAAHYCMLIMRLLCKNKSAASKMNVDQGLDCFNEIIAHFEEPCYEFPSLAIEAPWFKQKPLALLKHHTFGMLCRMDSLFSKWAIQEYVDERAHPSMGPLGTITVQFQNELIGIIYTNPEAYDETKIEERGKIIGGVLKDEHRIVAIATYAHMKKFIIDGAPNLFPQPEESEEKKPLTLPVDSEPMWEKLLFVLAETPAYQGVATAKAAPMYEALNYLEGKAIENLNSKPQAE